MGLLIYELLDIKASFYVPNPKTPKPRAAYMQNLEQIQIDAFLFLNDAELKLAACVFLSVLGSDFWTVGTKR